MPPYCRGSKHQKNGLAPLEERKRLCDPPNLPNLISVICLFPINMQPLALFLRKEPGGLSSISSADSIGGWGFRHSAINPGSQGTAGNVRSANRFVHRRNSPLQQIPTGCPSPLCRGRHCHPDRSDDAKPLLRGQRGAPVPLAGVSAGPPDGGAADPPPEARPSG